ncbi:SDR family oxidoreductase [Azospirillum halopraeferens]|uniref:SDR family oxidoreductase n=1 Tax=Azospirillum halopraeferens TaxID=34010 RepID=UPI0004036B90|nr:SDR family oxidoreductase [Azospirillum halopraeferens]
MDFRDRTVLVTGAGRGIGAAIARAFAAAGATVAVNYRQDADSAEAVAAACRAAGGDGWAVRADVTDPDAVRALVDAVAGETGRIDAVVNNAFRPYRFDPERRRTFTDTTWDDYRSQVDGAVHATYLVCRAALPVMLRHPGGSIVNMASDLVARPTVPYHDYTTAKAALIGFSRTLAADLGPLGIRVNCVAPGLVHPTDASRSTREEVREAIIAQTPLRRIATPDDVAGPVLFLASDRSRFMTGQTLYVDGGLVMG